MWAALGSGDAPADQAASKGGGGWRIPRLQLTLLESKKVGYKDFPSLAVKQHLLGNAIEHTNVHMPILLTAALAGDNS